VVKPYLLQTKSGLEIVFSGAMRRDFVGWERIDRQQTLQDIGNTGIHSAADVLQ
jgi:hypothetical protein